MNGFKVPTQLKRLPRGQSFLHQNLLSLMLMRTAATGIIHSSSNMNKYLPVTAFVGNTIEMDLKCIMPLLNIPMGKKTKYIELEYDGANKR